VLTKLSIAMAALGPYRDGSSGGTYSVGSDIVPGTYSSAGPAGSGRCYWKRLTGPNGNHIIDNALSSKPQVVQSTRVTPRFRRTAGSRGARQTGERRLFLRLTGDCRDVTTSVSAT
jgi:hypothetical protein